MRNNSTIGERLAQLRKEHGYSQNALAEQLEGFNRDHIVKFENDNVKNPKRELIAQLVQILHTSYEYLETGMGVKDTRNSVVHEESVPYQSKNDTYIFKLMELYLDNPSPQSKELLGAEIKKLQEELDKSKSEVQKYRDQIIAVLDRMKK